MKIHLHLKQNERGSAVVVILILLFCMIAFVMSTIRSLSNLHKEMQIVERQQMQKYRSPVAPASTNLNK